MNPWNAFTWLSSAALGVAAVAAVVPVTDLQRLADQGRRHTPS